VTSNGRRNVGGRDRKGEVVFRVLGDPIGRRGPENQDARSVSRLPKTNAFRRSGDAEVPNAFVVEDPGHRENAVPVRVGLDDCHQIGGPGPVLQDLNVVANRPQVYGGGYRGILDCVCRLIDGGGGEDDDAKRL
jgi:hypothetical protein